MPRSSGHFEPWLEGLAVGEHGPEDVDASLGEGENRLVMAFAFAPLAVSLALIGQVFSHGDEAAQRPAPRAVVPLWVPFFSAALA